jgi:hypothetical protein
VCVVCVILDGFGMRIFVVYGFVRAVFHVFP